ncbi:hypothetical protein [Tsuneonella suprasediminis]|uniref:hypothetical protein n=1 Tax=Tsuneonella suprasediminis TaxID=2306996 RepID=UPI002F952B02
MIGAFFQRFWEAVRDGMRLWWLAPIIPLIAALPEMVQHVAEVKLGMFASKEAFQTLAMDPTRWAFGYGKIAGLFIAIVAALLFWANRERGARWWNLRGILWGAVLGSVALQVIVGLAGEGITKAVPGLAGQAANLALSLATLPLIVWFIAGLVGDRAMTLAASYRRGWSPLLRIVVFLGLPYLLLMGIHMGDHYLAFGQSPAVVWALMIWDSLIVGTMAVLMGTALHHGYRPLGNGGHSGPVSQPDAMGAI